MGGKKAIQSILHKCPFKERRPVKPVIQNILPLPEEQMNTAKVFEVVILDGIGPFEIRKCGICNYNSLCEKNMLNHPLQSKSHMINNYNVELVNAGYH